MRVYRPAVTWPTVLRYELPDDAEPGTVITRPDSYARFRRTSDGWEMFKNESSLPLLPV